MTDYLLKEFKDLESNIHKFTNNLTSNSHLTCTKLYAEGKLEHYKKFLDDNDLRYKDCVFIKTDNSSDGYLTSKNNTK